MKITIIGTGNMGSGLAKHIANAGHEVTVTSRDFNKSQALASSLGNITASIANTAAQKSEVVIVATSYTDAITALHSMGDLTQKVIIDITNPLTEDYMGLTIGHTTSAAEEIAKKITGALVVKAFNTVFAQVLAEGPELLGEQVPVYYATDSQFAGEKVKSLIESIGFFPVNSGPLKNARYLEAVGGLNIYFGYGAGLGTSIAPSWIGIRK